MWFEKIDLLRMNTMFLALFMTLLNINRTFALGSHEDARIVDRILTRGREVMRLKNVDEGKDVGNCSRYLMPTNIGDYLITIKPMKPIRGNTMFLGTPVEFEVTKKDCMISNQVARGTFWVLQNAAMARAVAFGYTTLNRTAPLFIIAHGRNVELLGDIVFCSYTRRQKMADNGFAVYKNIIVRVSAETEVRTLALSILKACCPDADISQFIEVQNE